MPEAGAPREVEIPRDTCGTWVGAPFHGVQSALHAGDDKPRCIWDGTAARLTAWSREVGLATLK